MSSIYTEKNINFSETLAFGEAAEESLKKYFMSKGYGVRKANRMLGYDLQVKIDNDTIKNVESKCHNNTRRYKTFPLEIHQNVTKEVSVPEYMNDAYDIDIVIQIDFVSKVGFVFERETLKEYAKKNAHLAYEARNATSKIILVNWKDQNAGFKGVINLKDFLD